MKGRRWSRYHGISWLCFIRTLGYRDFELKKKAQQWKYDELHSLIRLKVYRTGYFKIIFDIVLNFQVMIKY